MPLPTERLYFRDLSPLSAEHAYWHACCNVEWVPITIDRMLTWDQNCPSTVYFLNPRTFRPVGATNGNQI